MPLLLPSLALNTTLVPFAAIALSMIAITIFVLAKVLPADGRPPLLTQMTLALAVIAGGSVLLLALVFVFVNTNGTAAWTWVLLAFNFMMTAPVGLWFVGLIMFRDRRIVPRGWLWPATVALATTGAEAIMGVLFALGDANGALGAGPAVALGLSSIWFFWSMAAIMTALIAWAPLSPVERGGLAALTGSALLAPWVTAFPTFGGAAMAVLMGSLFVLLLRPLLAGRVGAGEVGLLFGLAGAFGTTALAGLTVALAQGTLDADLVFGSTMAVVMGVEVAYLFRRFYQGPRHTPWVVRHGEPEPGAGPRPATNPDVRERRAPESSASSR